MSDDRWLVILVFAVWAVLALLYATVPMLHMPGGARIWGAGAVIFLVLALVVLAAERMAAARRRSRSSAPAAGGSGAAGGGPRYTLQ